MKLNKQIVSINRKNYDTETCSTFIVAAKTLICAAVCVTLTATVCVSADAIGNVIGGLRSNSKTYNRYKVVDISAANAIRLGKMKRANTYYEAYLKGNTVFIGLEISRYQAICRLETGRDVFVTSAFAAGCVATKAAAVRGVFASGNPHSSHINGGYPHYHAYGRRWVNDSNHSPHCWYPYN